MESLGLRLIDREDGGFKTHTLKMVQGPAARLRGPPLVLPCLLVLLLDLRDG